MKLHRGFGTEFCRAGLYCLPARFMSVTWHSEIDGPSPPPDEIRTSSTLVRQTFALIHALGIVVSGGRPISAYLTPEPEISERHEPPLIVRLLAVAILSAFMVIALIGFLFVARAFGFDEIFH